MSDSRGRLGASLLRVVGRVTALALACAALALGLPSSAAEPQAAWCVPGMLRVEDVPALIAPDDCAMVGRTVTAHGLSVVVPEPGRGRIVSGHGGAGEASLSVRTYSDGAVEIVSEGLHSDEGAAEAPVPTADSAAADSAAADPAPVADLTNDNIEDARRLPLGTKLSGQTTFGATRQAVDDRADALCFDPSSQLQETVWYRVKTTEPRDVLIELSNVQHFGDAWSYLVLEAFRRDADGVLQRVNCDAGHLETAPDVPYLIRVGTVYGTSTFDILARRATAQDRPANDLFADARDIGMTGRHDVERLRLASLQRGEPKPRCGPKVENTVWYRLRPDGNRRVKVASDGAVALHRGSALSTLRRVACVNDSEFDQALLKLPATGPLYLQLWREPAATRSTLRLTSGEPCPGCPPPCQAEHYAFYDQRPRRSALRWRFNASQVPSSLSTSSSLSAIKAGMSIVTGSRNDCGMADHVSAQVEYLGRTERSASLCSPGKRDGVNVVEFGKPPSDFLAVTCSEWVLRNGAARFVETDMRIRRSTRWTLNGDARSCLDAYDLVVTVAHETGHAFGLTHPTSAKAGNLSMFAESALCSGAGRTLGRGDVLGLRQLY